MKKEYVAIHKKIDVKLYFTYESELLVKLELVGIYKPEQTIWAIERIRNLATEVEMWKAIENKKLDFQYMEIPKDLSFEFFWKTYDYKKGKILMTQKAWQKLTDAEKIEALLYIPKLKEQKRIDNTAMPYPSTYLNGRYWLAEKI
ncbi:MAG: hypothetical protein E2590_12715 [Chryseobacterium sp.]|nr:hypothetical protein [Chryseobacterium sp.]